MTVFFTSDTHFGHAGVLGLFRRPFKGVAAMDEGLVRLWNETVGPADEVWHLGDFAIGHTQERMAEILARLAGRKRLVLGNNDSEETAALPGWVEVADRAELTLDGIPLVLTHHPLARWEGVNLHGHSHGRRKNPRPGQIDVGVDVWSYRPVAWKKLVSDTNFAAGLRGGRA
jgi:calcineurin-like phosphoesterase family protein